MQLKDNVAVSESGFIFNPNTGDSYSVNPIGQRLIQLFKDGQTQEEVVRTMTDEYFIDDATISKDLYDFHKLLVHYKLAD